MRLPRRADLRLSAELVLREEANVLDAPSLGTSLCHDALDPHCAGKELLAVGRLEHQGQHHGTLNGIRGIFRMFARHEQCVGSDFQLLLASTPAPKRCWGVRC